MAMVTMKKTMIAENDKPKNHPPPLPLDHHYLTILQLYGELTTMSLDKVILADYYPDGFGREKATVAEYGLFLVMLAHYGKPMTEAQLKELQPYATSSNLRKVLARMVTNGILRKRGQNYSLIPRANHTYPRIEEVLAKMLPRVQQWETAIRHFLEEYDRRKR
jgi:hypothetical protein